MTTVFKHTGTQHKPVMRDASQIAMYLRNYAVIAAAHSAWRLLTSSQPNGAQGVPAVQTFNKGGNLLLLQPFCGKWHAKAGRQHG